MGASSILGMRVGGRYSVTVSYVGTGNAFAPSDHGRRDGPPRRLHRRDVHGAGHQQEEPSRVSPRADPVFSSAPSGAATSVDREQIALIPTLNGRISDVTRLTPQSSGSKFAGDDRMNNITVDGSSFNNSFGLGGQPGDRTGVAPSHSRRSSRSRSGRGALRRAAGQLHRRQRQYRDAQRHQPRQRIVLSPFRDQVWVGTEARASGQSRHLSSSATPAAGRLGRWSAASCSSSAICEGDQADTRAAVDVQSEPGRRAGRSETA